MHIDEEGESEIKDCFVHVIRRTEGILSQSSFGSDDRNVSEVLTHVDLLERTIRLPDQVFRVSRWTIIRRVRLFDLEHT